MTMKKEALIRELDYEDLPHVMTIEKQAFTNPWSLAMFVLEMSKPSSICLAAVSRRNELYGYLVCSRYDDVWHLMNVSVEADLRRKGIAKLLLDRMFELSQKDDEKQQYTLEVRLTNVSAIKMYEVYGFRSAGIRRRYYKNDGEDALIMWRMSTVGGGQAGGRESGLLDQRR